MRPHADEFLQGREHIEIGGVAIRVFALRQRPRLFAQRATTDERQQFEQRVRGR